MALGNILKEARMRKKLSASEVAATTRMKIQLVQAIEQEDYSSFPATIYGKGFIKLFAECVDIDPTPLIEEYVSAVASGNVTQPAPIPVRKPRKILIDSEPPVEDIAKDNKKTNDKQPAQPELPIQDKVPDSKPEAEDNLPMDDLFSQLETDNKQPEKALYHPDKIEEATKEIKPEPVEREAETEIEPIPVTSQISLSTSTHEKKETKTVQSSAPITKRIADAPISLKKLNLSESHIKAASISAGILILLILMTTTISRCSKGKKETPAPAENATLQLAIPPADPYLE